MRKHGMGGHQSASMVKDEWLSPPKIITSLGEFDLDPCAPINRPWDIAKKHYTVIDDGLNQEWVGRVWCNPPYGSEAVKWLKKLADHGEGTALTFARTETKMFFNEVWPKAHGLLFLQGRLYFHHVDGNRASANAGAPSVLIAYGIKDSIILENCDLAGKFVRLKNA